MYDICCIGHITHDRVVTPRSEVHMPGGTSYYFSNAIRAIDVSYQLVTSLADKDVHIVEELRKQGTEVALLKSKHTVFFENIYEENLDNRKQRVREKADPFRMEDLQIAQARIFHLGPLLSDDISKDSIRYLAGKGAVSLDVQGFLREVQHESVRPIDWKDKKEVLPFISFLKTNESEMEVLTGCKDVKEGARILAEAGVKEVIITLGSQGSVILQEGVYHCIPAFKPKQSETLDATGCGDTYMAGYLSKRVRGFSIDEAAIYAAAMATLNLEVQGPFRGTDEAVRNLSDQAEKVYPKL